MSSGRPRRYWVNTLLMTRLVPCHPGFESGDGSGRSQIHRSPFRSTGSSLNVWVLVAIRAPPRSPRLRTQTPGCEHEQDGHVCRSEDPPHLPFHPYAGHICRVRGEAQYGEETVPLEDV